MDDAKKSARPVDEVGRAQGNAEVEAKSTTNFVIKDAPDADACKPSLRPYLDAGLQLIPLHKWNAKDSHGRDRGKTPRDSAWSVREYNTQAVALSAFDDGGNVGVRLPANIVVLDVDPRNFADDDSLLALMIDTGLDLRGVPHTRTGSGGDHYWFSKPTDVTLLDSLQTYPGVEFKSLGRQVVAAGSRHPNGRIYEWVGDSDLRELPPLPPIVLGLARRPVWSHATSAGFGELTPEMLAETLEQLDPTDFKDHDQWFLLMAACHHATAGEGRQEFIDWSTEDANYADDGWQIGRRWDSLHAEGASNGGKPITVRYLHKVVQAHGGMVPNVPPEDDFEETDEMLPVERDAIDDLNDKHAVVFEGGKFRIFTEEFDPVLRRPFFQRSTKEDFQNLYCNQLVESNDRVVTKGQYWLKSARRRQYKGVIFDPQREHEGWLNLWKGWAVQPIHGDWSLLKQLIRDVLVDRDHAGFEYVMNWMAYLFQHPNQPAEVAIAFKGAKGTGKGTLGRALHELVGRHSLHISSPEHLVGRFNSHLQNCVFLFADEAFWAGDKAGESKLKQLVTEPTMTYEGKGRDAVAGKNLIHILMASNNDWVVPAGLDGERRFAVFNVNDDRKGDEAFFDALNKQLYEQGGLAAMLHELLNRDLGDWSPRRNVPQTKALAEQKAMSMSPEEAWWDDLLASGILPVPFAEPDDWANGPVTIEGHALHTFYVEYVRRHGMGRARPLAGFAMAIKEKAGIGRSMIARKWQWVVPRLAEARAIWAKTTGHTD